MAIMLIERDRPFEALPFARRALEVGEATLGKSAPKLVGVLRTWPRPAARRAICRRHCTFINERI